jgi:hypothetical protein
VVRGHCLTTEIRGCQTEAALSTWLTTLWRQRPKLVWWDRSSPRAGPGFGIPSTPPVEAGTIFIPTKGIPGAQL